MKEKFRVWHRVQKSSTFKEKIIWRTEIPRKAMKEDTVSESTCN